MTESFPWPIQNVAEWMPLWKGAGFFLATFVLEDLAAVGAGLLLAAGAISWPVAFSSCFLGIWIGDAGLYALARYGGRKWFDRSSLRKFSAKVARSEQWFAKRGVLILIFSRCVPGARLPTYLAAGFLRLPLPRFLFVTGAAAFVWTLLVLWLAQSLGAQLVHWVEAYKHGSIFLLGVGIALFAALQLLRQAVTNFDSRVFTARLGRWRHWEFWPAWAFYPPVVLYCLWLMIKYRGISLPTLANPGIFSGGLVGESKMAMLDNLMATSSQFTASAALITGDTFENRLQALETIRVRLHLEFPFILKPDLGQRGNGVKVIRTQKQAEDYLRRINIPLVVQRYAAGPHEAGVFYYRFPGEPHGRIFAMTEKVFPVLTGDGSSTIAELIRSDSRARFMAETYLKRLGSDANSVPAHGEPVRLVESGNHAQGCIFRDGMHLYSPELEARIDEISVKLDGFFIGRYDIRYSTEADLRAGRDFQIIELNGAASEATNIYDARNSLWSAYRTLFRQWNLVFAIGAQNRQRGCVPDAVPAVWKKWREYLRLADTYPTAD